MAYIPPSPFVFIISSGYSPPSPFIFRVGETSTTIAYGTINQPLDFIYGEAVSPITCSGDFQQSVDSISAIQWYNSGDFQQLVDLIYGEVFSPFIAFGAIDHLTDIVYGEATNSAPITDWIAGNFQQSKDTIFGNAVNNVLLGRYICPIDIISGSTTNSILCYGKFSPIVDSIYASGVIAESIGTGEILQNVDYVSGFAISPFITYGDYRQKIDSIEGVANSSYIHFAYGIFSQKIDYFYGSAFSIIPTVGIVNQFCDKLTGSAWSTNVCVENISSKVDTIRGMIKQINSYQNLHFLRDEIIQPENNSINNNSLQFSYNTIITGASSAPEILPIHFER